MIPQLIAEFSPFTKALPCALPPVCLCTCYLLWTWVFHICHFLPNYVFSSGFGFVFWVWSKIFWSVSCVVCIVLHDIDTEFCNIFKQPTNIYAVNFRITICILSYTYHLRCGFVKCNNQLHKCISDTGLKYLIKFEMNDFYFLFL
jgi:hypothetical protein